MSGEFKRRPFTSSSPEEFFPKRKCPTHGQAAEAGHPLICCMEL